MQDIIQRAGDMDELGNVMVVELKFLEGEKMPDITQITRNKVIHTNHMIPFLYTAVAQVRTQETGGAGYKHSFLAHAIVLFVIGRFGYRTANAFVIKSQFLN